MKKYNGNAKKAPQELLGIDFSTSGVKVVRLKKVKNELSLLGAELFPCGDTFFDVTLPKEYLANYAAMCYTADSAVIRIMSTSSDGMENAGFLNAQMNVDNSFRTACDYIQRGKGKQESLVLGVAIPEADVQQALSSFAAGPPALVSLEVSGLAAFQAVLTLHKSEIASEPVCLLDMGATTTTAAFVDSGKMTLVSRVTSGVREIEKRIKNDLGVDDDMALTILQGASVDVSSSLDVVFSPLVRQLSISRDFISRKTKQRVGKVYVSGGMAQSGLLCEHLGKTLEMELIRWDPAALLKDGKENWPAHLTTEKSRFAAAIGAAIGALVD